MSEQKAWDKEKKGAFQQEFVQWYEENQRILPWRATHEPYAIWVSEIMLQQTRVETVIPYFNRFMEWFPEIKDLAAAPEDKLLKAWEGLGYYSRVRNLQKAAQQIMENFAGEMPRTIEEISSLKGIGPYTAGAIASIAFNQPEPAIDGNVMRVFSRLFRISADIAKPSSRKIFDQRVREVISPDKPSEFNQAIMDLGATICTPTSPKCERCPIQNYCQAYQEDNVTAYPVKVKKTKVKKVYYVACAIQNEKQEFLLEKRPATGLLSNMWTFPLIEVTEQAYLDYQKGWQSYTVDRNQPQQLSLVAEEEDMYMIKTLVEELEGADHFENLIWQKQPIGEITHIFSHLKWFVLLAYGRETGNGRLLLTEKQAWVRAENFDQLVFPKPQQKLVQQLLSNKLF